MKERKAKNGEDRSTGADKEEGKKRRGYRGAMGLRRKREK